MEDMRKTGHIIVDSDFKLPADHYLSVDMWRYLVANGKAIFLNKAFNVVTTSTDNVTHVESVYKRKLQKPLFKNISIIDIYENGELRFLYDSENYIISGMPTLIYEVLPYEPDTYNTKGQTKIIFETISERVNKHFIADYLEFNPNQL